jgi:hypothetical protein
MRKRLNGIHGGGIARAFGAAALGALVLVAVLLVWLRLVGSASPALVALGGVALGGAVYGLLLVLLRVPEVRTLFNALKRRLSPR